MGENCEVGSHLIMIKTVKCSNINMTHMSNVLWLNMLYDLLDLLHCHCGWHSFLRLNYQLCLNTCFPTHLKKAEVIINLQKILQMI